MLQSWSVLLVYKKVSVIKHPWNENADLLNVSAYGIPVLIVSQHLLGAAKSRTYTWGTRLSVLGAGTSDEKQNGG